MTKVVIITGASGGLGSSLTAALLSDNWIVIAGTRQPANAAGLQDLKNQYQDQLVIQVADVTSTRDIQQLVDTACKCGELTAIINNAGTANGQALEEISVADFTEILAVNVVAAHTLTKFALPSLRQNNGIIVNISSLVGRVPLPYLGAYSASKHALSAMTVASSLELLGSTVSTILVEPGPLTSKLCGDAIGVPENPAYTKPQSSMREGVRQVSKKHSVATTNAADQIVRAMRTKKTFRRLVIGRWTRLILVLHQILPSSLTQRLLAWYYHVDLR